MKKKEEQGCLRPLLIAIVLVLAATLVYQFFIQDKPKEYNPLENVIQVNEPILKVDNNDRYYISNKRSYYRIKSEEEKEALLKSLDKKTKELEEKVKQQNINIHITIEDERW